MKNARRRKNKASAGGSTQSIAQSQTSHSAVIRLKPTARMLRAMYFLLSKRDVTSAELADAAGCANAPDMVKTMRDKGLDVPCHMERFIDRDGCTCFRGRYHLSSHDQVLVRRWLDFHRGGA
ncbi:hypothetical protein [Silvimonas iriomotensis]|uniref:hypothetical protein n=1 Tax=Silvimonas iriomotensis TaxID=449662 RepID=UPI0016648F39|nr:hypothetical protein [Silvimonas iriomotensis]